MAQLALPDQAYNWIGNFLQGHSQCTKFAWKVSEPAEIFNSVIQGSGLGPAAFLFTAADLSPIHGGNGNEILKYADDTNLVIPAANTHTCPEQLLHIEAWAATNNMQLNNAKTKEIAQPTRERSAASTVAARHRTSEQHHSTNQRSTDGNRSRQLYILTGVGHKPPGHKPHPDRSPPFPPSACTEQTNVVTKLFIYLYT